MNHLHAQSATLLGMGLFVLLAPAMAADTDSTSVPQLLPYPAPIVVEPPIEEVIPLLKGRTPEQQLATLQWMRKAPGNKIVSLFPDLKADRIRMLADRAITAQIRIDRLIYRLEQAGYQAPALPANFVPARSEP